MRACLRLTLVTTTVGGGFTGVAVTSQALFEPQAKAPGSIALCVTFVLLYTFVLVGGLLFTQNSRRVLPIAAALGLQIPVVSSPVVAYQFGAGLLLPVGFSEEGFFWGLRFGAHWQLYYLSPSLPWGFGVNLVAAVLLAALSWSVSREVQPPA